MFSLVFIILKFSEFPALPPPLFENPAYATADAQHKTHWNMMQQHFTSFIVLYWHQYIWHGQMMSSEFFSKAEGSLSLAVTYRFCKLYYVDYWLKKIFFREVDQAIKYFVSERVGLRFKSRAD